MIAARRSHGPRMFLTPFRTRGKKVFPDVWQYQSPTAFGTTPPITRGTRSHFFRAGGWLALLVICEAKQPHEPFEGRDLIAESMIAALFEITREHQYEEAEKEKRSPQKQWQDGSRRKICEQRFAGIEAERETINAARERESLNEPAEVEFDHGGVEGVAHGVWSTTEPCAAPFAPCRVSVPLLPKTSPRPSRLGSPSLRR